MNSVPLDNKGWDKVFYGRYAKSAKEMLLVLGNVEDALDCMEMVIDHCRVKGITYGFETVLKMSHLYFDKKKVK